MDFKELTESEYAGFLKEWPTPNFWQSVDMMHLREKRGWYTNYVGIFHQNQIIAAAAISFRKVFKSFSIAQAVRGFYIDYHDYSLMTYFHKELIKYLKKKGAIVFRTDPYICYKERDIDGNFVKDGFDNSDVVDIFKKLHYHHDGFLRGMDNSREPNWMFVLNLEGKNEAQLLKEFDQQTRWAINKTKKMGIRVHEITEEELPRFKAIMDHTAQRRGFEDHDISYYHQLFDTFGKSGHLKILIADLDLIEYQDRLKHQKEELMKDLLEIEQQLKQIPGSKKYNKKRNVILDDLKTVEKNQKEAIELNKNAENGVLTLAGATFIDAGKEEVYLYSGAYGQYMHLHASYAIQWYMIRYALSRGFTRYNFYGISGYFEKGQEGFGIYEFKRGFTGHVEELIGDFEYPVKPMLYNLYNLLRKLKNHH